MGYNKSVLAGNLRGFRAKKRMTQAELAVASGVNEATIFNYENGTNVPGIDKIVSIAEVLGCTPNDLCGWK